MHPSPQPLPVTRGFTTGFRLAVLIDLVALVALAVAVVVSTFAVRQVSVTGVTREVRPYDAEVAVQEGQSFVLFHQRFATAWHVVRRGGLVTVAGLRATGQQGADTAGTGYVTIRFLDHGRTVAVVSCSSNDVPGAGSGTAFVCRPTPVPAAAWNGFSVSGYATP